MKKILILCCLAGLFSACSHFLKEYSQGLAKVESLDDLDEVILGKGYFPVGRFVQGYGTQMPTDIYFKTVHLMSDELSFSSTVPNMGLDITGMRNQMFGWHTWQQEVGLPYEGDTRTAEDKDWNQIYSCINICNMVLTSADELPANNRLQHLQQKRIKGEASFLRALYYFTLANLYGKPYCPQNLNTPAVPIKLTEYVEDKDYTVGTVEEVYSQVLADLDEAEGFLNDNEGKNHPYRADITAVYLLKSRVFLYMQDWEKALEYARKCLEKRNGLLDMNTYVPTGDVLSKLSPETIFSMGGYPLATMIHFQNSASGNYPIYVISDDLAEAFTEGDNDWRTQYYILKQDIGGSSTDYVYSPAWVLAKIKGWEEFGAKEASDNFMFRTAEAYLNAAEAAACSGDEATARRMLKTLRDNRLKESKELTESGKELIDLIRRERQCELCLEGHRWFDLRRYTVCEPFPWSKKITHCHTKYAMVGWQEKMVETKSYTLEENDGAYTLSLPKEVIDFQNTLQSNRRPARPGKLVE